MRKLMTVALFLIASPAFANELQDNTLIAWNDYVAVATVRFQSDPLVHLTAEQRSRLRAGEILIHPWSKDFPVHVPHGLIHDWVGTMFIPHTNVADLTAVVRDYDHYPKYFSTTITKAKTLSQTNNSDEFVLRMVEHVPLVTVVIEGEFDTEYAPVDVTHGYSISHSVRLQAVENSGQSDERILPSDQGPGYVWRLYNFTTFEERDGGVYIEVEVLGLSRDIPLMLRWLVAPIVAHQPGDSLQAALKKTRDVVIDHHCWLPEGCGGIIKQRTP